MKYSFEFLSLTQLSHEFETVASTIGHWLKELGLREYDKAGLLVPTQKAHNLGLVKLHENPSNGERFYVWRHPDTIKLLVAAGHPLPKENGSPMATSSDDNRVFSFRAEAGSTNHFEIVTDDDRFQARCQGRRNAATITKALNYLAEKGKIEFDDQVPGDFLDGLEIGI